MLKKIHDYLIMLSKIKIFFVCLLIICPIAILDYITGYEISLFIFYLIPVSIGSWYTGRISGFMVSVIAALIWLIVDFISGHPYSSIFILFWNAGAGLGFFLITAYLLSSIKFHLDREYKLARIDSLTDAMNSRGFEEEARTVFSMAVRHGAHLTIAYIDIDNFKFINDTRGHSEGDNLLKMVVHVLRQSVRDYDLIARLGGDEFALLFPMTDYQAANNTIRRLRDILCNMVSQKNWPVTFSIGVVTFESLPKSIDDAIRIADNLMYKIKHGGKNNIAHQIWKNGLLQ